ncbi:helix-turn-helix domain-containing protein [Proteiniphilum sp.]|uniref:TetR/AcrR family transcriptional regulator n=1 Tax=Proteiniphilum sp. TaxID=1926877 RepID=UPI002B21186F|nr:helix-turn-helix domain-containing protein [Proteiniphilum sp.]MEA4918812.1 helix-turn-helix domain-containing protein [Proteiniphilum sp.]
MNEAREHILKKATVLFLQKNFKAVTMKDIVDATGLSKGAFYHYFPSKEKLFLEIVETYTKMLSIDFESFSKNSFYEFYHDYIVSSFKKFMKLKEFLGDTNDEDDITYFTLTYDAMNLFPGFSERVKKLHVEELSAWEKVLQLAIKRGEIKSSMTAMQIAQIFVYISDGIGQRLIMEGQIRGIQDQLLALWDSLYADLKA